MMFYYYFGPYYSAAFKWLCKSPPGLCVHGPATCGSRDVVPGVASPAGLHQSADLLLARTIHSSGWSHRTTSPRRTAAGHGGLCQPRGCGTLHRWELLLLPGEWWCSWKLCCHGKHCILDFKWGFSEGCGYRWLWIWTFFVFAHMLKFFGGGSEHWHIICEIKLYKKTR